MSSSRVTYAKYNFLRKRQVIEYVEDGNSMQKDNFISNLLRLLEIYIRLKIKLCQCQSVKINTGGKFIQKEIHILIKIFIIILMIGKEIVRLRVVEAWDNVPESLIISAWKKAFPELNEMEYF